MHQTNEQTNAGQEPDKKIDSTEQLSDTNKASAMGETGDGSKIAADPADLHGQGQDQELTTEDPEFAKALIKEFAMELRTAIRQEIQILVADLATRIDAISEQQRAIADSLIDLSSVVEVSQQTTNQINAVTTTIKEQAAANCNMLSKIEIKLLAISNLQTAEFV